MALEKQLYTAASLHEAQFLLDLLAEAGIGATLHNENLVGMVAFLPESATLPTVWVKDEADWERGREVVKVYEERRSQTVDAEITCPACGETNPANFELCWKCRAALV